MTQPQSSNTEWQAVWECPRCGLQMAVGEDRVAIDPDGRAWRWTGAKVTLKRPNCCMAHEPVEMEQKLTAAMPFQPDEMPPFRDVA